MLSIISDILFGIWNFLVSVFDLIAGLIRDLAAVARFLVSAIAAVPSYLSWFPGAFPALILVGCSIAVVYKLTGREG